MGWGLLRILTLRLPLIFDTSVEGTGLAGCQAALGRCVEGLCGGIGSPMTIGTREEMSVKGTKYYEKYGGGCPVAFDNVPAEKPLLKGKQPFLTLAGQLIGHTYYHEIGGRAMYSLWSSMATLL